MLISHYQHLEEQEGEAFGPELVLRGARERLAPIVMTALTTALALLPFVLFGNIPGHEIVRPMAIVILGGLVTSTLLNLFVLPALYLRFGASREPILGCSAPPCIAGDAAQAMLSLRMLAASELTSGASARDRSFEPLSEIGRCVGHVWFNGNDSENTSAPA